MKISEIIVTVFAYALGWCIWNKVVDRADEFVRKRVSSKTYDIVNLCAIIILSGIILYVLFK